MLEATLIIIALALFAILWTLERIRDAVEKAAPARHVPRLD